MSSYRWLGRSCQKLHLQQITNNLATGLALSASGFPKPGGPMVRRRVFAPGRLSAVSEEGRSGDRGINLRSGALEEKAEEEEEGTGGSLEDLLTLLEETGN